jgi:hypothetical protein
MADEPENLVLALLREIRGSVAAVDAKVDRKFDQLDAKIDRVDSKVDSVIEQMIDLARRLHTGTGDRARREAANRDIADLKRRLEALEGRCLPQPGGAVGRNRHSRRDAV